LDDIKVDSRVEYCGFLPASKYIKENVELLGENNIDYIQKRYYFKNENKRK